MDEIKHIGIKQEVLGHGPLMLACIDCQTYVM